MEASHTGILALIVDDEVDICALLSYVLNKNHIQSDSVTSIREAKSALENEHPDVMLLDNHLSDGLGVDFIPFVRSHYPSVRIIMITAFDGTEEKEKAMSRGASAFISKPFSQEDILEAVHELDA
jgi:DNA-binding response OmpR family regulator